MLPCDRSHQLGKGQSQCAGMSLLTRPSRPVYGSQLRCTEMSNLCRSHQLGEGHQCDAEMPKRTHPPRLVYGSQSHGTAMSHLVRSHQFTGAFVTTQQCPSMIAPTYSREVKHHSQKCQGSHASQGKGHHGPAEMPFMVHPSPPVYGRVRRDPQQCHGDCTLPPVRKGHNLYANQAATVSPFSFNLWEPL